MVEDGIDQDAAFDISDGKTATRVAKVSLVLELEPCRIPSTTILWDPN